MGAMVDHVLLWYNIISVNVEKQEITSEKYSSE
jgi:hypothetical protein